MTTEEGSPLRNGMDEKSKEADNDESKLKYPIILDCMVEVLPRTWPGINKPGGAARVTRCHFSKPQTPGDNDSPERLTHVDVRYVVVGGRERSVPIEYCLPAPQYDAKYNDVKESTNPQPIDSCENVSTTNLSMIARRTRIHLRDRSALLGRCKRCGSLRNDCGSCDWVEEEEKLKRMQIQLEKEKKDKERIAVDGKEARKVTCRQHAPSSRVRKRTKVKTYADKVESEGSSSQKSWSSFSSSDESYPSYRRKYIVNPLQRQRTYINETSSSSYDDSDSDSDSLDEDDIALSKLNNLHKLRLKRAKLLAHRLALRSSERTGIETIHQKRRKRRMYFEHRRKRLELKFVDVRRRDKDLGNEEATNDTEMSVLENMGASLNWNSARGKITIPTGADQGKATNSQQIYESDDVLDKRLSVPSTLSAKQDELDRHCSEEGAVIEGINDTPSTREKCLDSGGNIESVINCSGLNNMSQNEKVIGYVYDSDIGDQEEEDIDIQTIALSRQNEHSRIQPGDLEKKEVTMKTVVDPKDKTDDTTDDMLNTDKTFIQPEGEAAAQELPHDVQDKTAGLQYVSLPLFFEKKVKELKKKIPEAEAAGRELVRRIENARNESNQKSQEMLGTVESDSWTHYNLLLKELIQDGTDQCRLALKRLLDRRQFKAAKKKCNGEKLKWSHIERLDLLYDNIADSAEAIVREARQIAISLSSTGGTSFSSIHNSDTLASPIYESGHQRNSESASFDEFHTKNKLDFLHEPVSDFDRHAHAFKVKRVGTKNRKRANAGKRRRKQYIASTSRAVELNNNDKGDAHGESFSSYNESTRRLNECHDVILERYASLYPPKKLCKKRKSYKERSTSSRTVHQSTRGQSWISESEHLYIPHSLSSEENTGKEFHPKQSSNCSSGSTSTVLPSMSTFSNNIGRSLEGPISESTENKFQQARHRAKAGHVKHSHTSKQYSVRMPGTLSSLNDGNNNYFFQQEALFLMIEQNNKSVRNGDEEIQSNDETKMTISQFCDKMIQSFDTHHDSAITLIRILPSYFDIEHKSCSHSRESALIAFRTILGVIKKNGLPSLQEMIHTRNKHLLVNLNLMICVLKLFHLSAHSYLTHNDGLIFDIFKQNGPSSFVNVIILQMLDVVYSQVLPVQWGSPRPLSQDVIDGLLELRNHIGKVTHLPEAVSHSLLSIFDCQNWHRSERECENKWFCSAIDPRELARYWSGGSKELTSSKSVIRLSQFRKKYPRSEINALWSIFAFFGTTSCTTSNNIAQNGANSRWKLISSLLLSQGGILGVQKEQLKNDDKDKKSVKNRIPSGEHMKRCVTEIRYLCTLLSSGSIDPLCEDSLVLKLIRNAVTLDIDNYRNSYTNFRFNSPTNAAKREDLRLMFELWNETDLSNIQSSSDSLLARRLFADFTSYSPIKENESMFTLSSNSNILRSLQSLISSWIARLTLTKKKARWSRFLDSISSLVNIFLKNGERIRREDSENKVANISVSSNDFENSFFPIRRCVNTNFTSCWDAYNEAAACILISVIHASTKVDPPIDSSGIFDKKYCNRLWEIVSNDSLKTYQNYLVRRKPLNGNVGKCDSLCSLLLAMKVMSSLMIHYLTAVEHVSDGTKNSEYDYDDMFEFLISCILAGLLSICNLFMVINKHEQDNCTLASSQSSRQDANTESITCANVLANGCFWLACILNYSRSILVQLQSTEKNFVTQQIDFVSFSKNILCLVNPVLYMCLTEIKQAPNLGLSSDLCLRSCLTLLRSAVGLRHEADKVNTSCNIQPTQKKINRDQVSLSSQAAINNELMGGIDDDILMNINLESVTNKKVIQEINTDCMRQSALDPSVRNIWKFLVQTLEQIKPSLCYMVPSYVIGNDGNRMSTYGKVVWARHAGGICAALASLCTFESQSINDGGEVIGSQLHQLLRRKDSVGLTNSDKIYHRQVGQCFIAELCRVARVSRVCLFVLNTGISDVLNTCIEALVDASTMDLFPTTNSSLLATVGGERSKEKEKRRIEAINDALVDAVHQSGHYPDIEASGIRRRKKDVKDTPGPSYMSGHMWSFCSDLGHCLTELSLVENQSDNTKAKLGRLGVALVKNDDDLPLHLKLVCDETLQALAPVSLERECMKRMMKLRNVFSAILCKDLAYDDVQSVSLLIKALLDQLIDIVTGVQYYEKNGLRNDLHIHAKARVLQFTFAQFVVFLLTWLSRELAFTDSHAKAQAKFIWDRVIAPSLRLCGFDHLSLKKEISAGIPLDPSLSSISTKPDTSTIDTHDLSTISEDLFIAVNSCISSLVVPIVSALFHSSESTTMFELINAYISGKSSNSSLTVNIIPLMIPSMENGADSTAHDLNGGLDIYLSLTSIGNTHHDKVHANAINKFRRFALRDVMLLKLRHDTFPREKKIRILILLKKILDVEWLSKECVEPYDFEVSLNHNCNCFLDIIDCCYIINAFSLCIICWCNKTTIHDSILEQVFLCCKHVLKLQIEGGEMSLMGWCRMYAVNDEYASYLKVAMEWIFEVASFLTGPSWKDFMEEFCHLTGNNKDKIYTERKDAQSKAFLLKLEHWQSLLKDKQKLEKKIFQTENASTGTFHPYHKVMRESESSPSESFVTVEPSMIESAKRFITVYLRINSMKSIA